MAHKLTTSYLEDSLEMFRQYKQLAERAMAQANDQHLFTVLDGDENSIALIVKHMTGNMRSRWTDFLTTDGEKPDRHRDSEFVEPPADPRGADGNLGERMALCIRGAGAALGKRPGAHGHHSRRGAFGDAGHQPPDRALCAAHRPDHSAGEALRRRRVDDVEHSEEEGSGIGVGDQGARA